MKNKGIVTHNSNCPNQRFDYGKYIDITPKCESITERQSNPIEYKRNNSLAKQRGESSLNHDEEYKYEINWSGLKDKWNKFWEVEPEIKSTTAGDSSGWLYAFIIITALITYQFWPNTYPLLLICGILLFEIIKEHIKEVSNREPASTGKNTEPAEGTAGNNLKPTPGRPTLTGTATPTDSVPALRK